MSNSSPYDTKSLEGTNKYYKEETKKKLLQEYSEAYEILTEGNESEESVYTTKDFSYFVDKTAFNKNQDTWEFTDISNLETTAKYVSPEDVYFLETRRAPGSEKRSTDLELVRRKMGLNDISHIEWMKLLGDNYAYDTSNIIGLINQYQKDKSTIDEMKYEDIALLIDSSQYLSEEGELLDYSKTQITGENLLKALASNKDIVSDSQKLVDPSKSIVLEDESISTFFSDYATEDQINIIKNVSEDEKIQKMLEIINEHFTQNFETMKKEFLAQENDLKTYWKTLSDSQEIINSFAEHDLFSKEIAEWKGESFAEIIEQENLEYTLNAVTNSLEGLENAAEYTTSALTKMYADDTKKFSNMVAKLEDVSEVLTKDNRESLEYTTAFSEATNMINAFFGSSLGTDFFGTEDMQEAVEKFVSGSEEGWKAIQDEAAKKGWAELEGRGMSAEDIKAIKAALSDVEEGEIFKYEDLKIDSDDEKYIDAINQILGAQGFSSISDNTKETLSVIKYDTSALEKLKEDNDDDTWQNPWDWLYNKNNEINQLIREREKLERSYQKILEDENSSVEDVLKNRAERIGKLNEQLTEEKDKQNTAREQKNQVQTQINELGFSEYMKINAKGIMEIDHKKIEEDLDAEEISAEDGAILEALEAEWDEAHQAEQDAIDTQEEIEDEVKEIKEEGRDELSDLYDQVKEGLIMSYQEEIDALTEINDTIADSQSKMLDKIQEQIDEQRQARENEKTEQNLEDKRQRLNYLRMDTSGANAVEIAQLEKELGEEEQNYQDSLVDQQLQKLQADNEKAKEQRDRQIQLMNDQLQAYGESQIVWEDVQKILTNAWKSGQGFMTTPAGEFVGMANKIEEMNPIELEDFNKENAITNKMAKAYALQEELTNPKSSEERTNLSTLKNNIKTLEDTLTTKLVGTTKTNLADAVHSVEQAIKKAKNNNDDDNPGGLSGTNGNDSLLPPLLNKERMKLLDEDKDNFAWQSALAMASKGVNAGKLFSNIKEHYKLSSEEDVQNFASEALKYWKPSSSFLSPTNNGSNQTSSNDSSEGEKDLNKYEMFDTIIQASSEDFKADNQRTSRGIDIAKYLDFTDSAPDSWLAMYTKQLAYFLGEARNDTERAKILQGLEDADDKLKYIGGLADNSTNIPGLDFYDKTNGRTYWVEHIDAEGHLHYIDTSSGRNTVQKSKQAYDNADVWRNLKLLKYQTGGLADFTGPAWLDGTKSHPELVLNQQDTQNFIALKDILADVMDSTKGTITNSTTNGDNYYEIEINVEGINNDYDVEQIADKIKSMIQNDAMYRNVNALQKTSK